LAIKGRTPAEVEEALRSPIMMLGIFVIDSVFTVLGGFVAARIAPTRKLEHARYLGILFFCLIFLVGTAEFILNGFTKGESWIIYDVIGLILVVPLTSMGGRLALK
jgi:hypothetical protein